jgi:hypothetical protein
VTAGGRSSRGKLCASGSPVPKGSRSNPRQNAPRPTHLQVANETARTNAALEQISKAMTLTPMVPYQYLSNFTQLTNRFGQPVSVTVR